MRDTAGEGVSASKRTNEFEIPINLQCLWSMRAVIADMLTASRILLAMLLAFAVAIDSWPFATVILVIAWLTDLLDGRLARATSEPTRLGDWDFRVDVALGVAILIGLMLSGIASSWLVVAAVATLAGLTIMTGNPAPSMLLLAFAYGWFLWILLDRRPTFWWLPFSSIVFLLIVDWRRFFSVILPAFFRGLSTFSQSDNPDPTPVLDRWA